VQELHETEETTKFGDESKKYFKELPKAIMLPSKTFEKPWANYSIRPFN